MSKFLSKLLQPLNKSFSEDKPDPSLMQGARFNIMQSTITQPVFSNLNLMDQTTGLGLGSIMETMENMDQDYTKALDDLDKKEVAELVKVENSYNGLIKNMQTKQQLMNSSIMKQKGKAEINQLRKEIQDLDNKIMQKANELTGDAYKRTKINGNVQNGMNIESDKLQKQILMLKSKKNRLNSLVQQQDDLDGQIADRQNELDSSYMNYIVWFLCATTLGILAVRQLGK
jgi:hypothetical protein